MKNKRNDSKNFFITAWRDQIIYKLTLLVGMVRRLFWGDFLNAKMEWDDEERSEKEGGGLN